MVFCKFVHLFTNSANRIEILADGKVQIESGVTISNAGGYRMQILYMIMKNW